MVERLKDVIRGVKSIPTVSTFSNDGKITPAEFIRAGDQLIFKCPAWRWDGGQEGRRVAYLPAEKQCLVTRGVPCRKRASEVTRDRTETLLEQGEQDEEGWLATDFDESAPPAPAPEATSTATTEEPAPAQDDDSDDDLPDFGFGDDDDDDEAALQTAGDDCRTYDASITYDILYQSARLWLVGYDASGAPLSREAMFEDFTEEHARKTVTFETHPHLGTPYASIHPCKHANVMKVMIDRVHVGGRAIQPDDYFFMFLKFMSSVIPTIEYANTIEME
eukprot:gnl/Trimastix_PCT/806.p1 GENE.gnl/Trimastix_PCT/806~~gnl/Trimastix_PCT/806.p1  ORF type:complete len:277 (-),score=41.27 gnl/Trimastix_PCT/806:72-902(-)